MKNIWMKRMKPVVYLKNMGFCGKAQPALGFVNNPDAAMQVQSINGWPRKTCNNN